MLKIGFFTSLKKFSDLATVEHHAQMTVINYLTGLPSSDGLCAPYFSLTPFVTHLASFTDACYFPGSHRYLSLWTLI